MAYQAKLSQGAVLKISNHDGQTKLVFQNQGGSETQSSSVSTGEWKSKPTLFETEEGLVLRIEADETHYTDIKEGSARSLDKEPGLKGAQTLSLEEISDEDAQAPHMKPMEPMQPMKPMAPMKPMDS